MIEGARSNLDLADRSKALRNSAIFLMLEAIVSTNSLLFQSCWIWLCTDDILCTHTLTYCVYIVRGNFQIRAKNVSVH